MSCPTSWHPSSFVATRKCRHQRGRLVKIVRSRHSATIRRFARAPRRSPALPLCSLHPVSRRAARPATVPVAMVSRATQPLCEALHKDYYVKSGIMRSVRSGCRAMEDRRGPLLQASRRLRDPSSLTVATPVTAVGIATPLIISFDAAEVELKLRVDGTIRRRFVLSSATCRRMFGEPLRRRFEWAYRQRDDRKRAQGAPQDE